jgi:hypothetical protein
MEFMKSKIVEIGLTALLSVATYDSLESKSFASQSQEEANQSRQEQVTKVDYEKLNLLYFNYVGNNAEGQPIYESPSGTVPMRVTRENNQNVVYVKNSGTSTFEKQNLTAEELEYVYFRYRMLPQVRMKDLRNGGFVCEEKNESNLNPELSEDLKDVFFVSCYKHFRENENQNKLATESFEINTYGQEDGEPVLYTIVSNIPTTEWNDMDAKKLSQNSKFIIIKNNGKAVVPVTDIATREFIANQLLLAKEKK